MGMMIDADWYSVMENELNKAGLDVKVEKVPNSRCASSSSIRELNEKIKYRIKENEDICVRSLLISSLGEYRW